MNNPFKRYVQHFLSFSRSDRNAIIIIAVLVLLGFGVNILLQNTRFKSTSDFTAIKELIREWELAETEKQQTLILFDFDPNTITKLKLDSLSIPKQVKQNILSYRSAGGKYKTSADVRKIYGMNDSIFSLIESRINIKQNKEPERKVRKVKKLEPKGTFDPNMTTLEELKTFGFSNYQANNLVNYRKKGGSFNMPADILRIYGIDSTFYLGVEQYISIALTESEPMNEVDKMVRIEINSADSFDLKKLDGIGSWYAKRIIKYRKLLGGFSSKEQIKEVYNFPEETYMKIEEHIFVDTLKISRLRINFFEYAELIQHPYLNKNDVKLILKTRESGGAFKNISEVKAIKGFDAETFRKIRPYITCR